MRGQAEGASPNANQIPHSEPGKAGRIVNKRTVWEDLAVLIGIIILRATSRLQHHAVHEKIRRPKVSHLTVATQSDGQHKQPGKPMGTRV